MTGVVILCSGQGAQAAGMFDVIGEAPEAAPVFAAARRVLGDRDPRDLVRQASEEELHANSVAQVLCCTQSLAYWAALGSATPRPIAVAGYSAGELAAWGIAGVVDAGAVLELAAKRAALMDNATYTPSGLAAILGLPRTSIDGICREHDLHVAIINGPQHFIVGGRVADLQQALARAEALGAARAILLPITVASHTCLLREASERFGDVLSQRIGTAHVPGDVRLISGIDGASVLHVEDGLRKLALQVQQTVNWAACMDVCRAVRPQRILELGPGDALARMMTEAAPDVFARSVDAFRSLEGIRHWLNACP